MQAKPTSLYAELPPEVRERLGAEDTTGERLQATVRAWLEEIDDLLAEEPEQDDGLYFVEGCNRD